MTFIPTPEKLMPDLTPREELVILARALWREGYNDHLAGHITYNLRDDTLLCNPWLIAWNELRPEQVIRIDLEGTVLEGDWPAPLGIPLHLELHRMRPGVTWALHNHPLYGTIWADMGEIPPAMDQSSGLGGGDLVLVSEYEGGVGSSEIAHNAITAMGQGDIALLRGHGVLILGSSARAIYQRAVALEQRCQHAWCIQVAGGSLVSPLPAGWLERIKALDGHEFPGYWEVAVRQELRADIDLLSF
jgi:ribulose-5-phosphate 4-epimerase/fuculose-1-phosphate aldolase